MGWSPYGPIYPLTAPPAVSTLTWVNQGAAVAADGPNGIYLSTPAAAGNSLKGLLKATPTPPYEVTFGLLPLVPPANWGQAGVCWRESGTDEWVVVELIHVSGYRINITKFTNATTESAKYVDGANPGALFCGGLWWVRLADDGTNRVVSMSQDGQNWLAIHSVGRTDHLTADQYGLFVTANNGTYPVGLTCLSWLEA